MTIDYYNDIDIINFEQNVFIFFINIINFISTNIYKIYCAQSSEFMLIAFNNLI